MGIKHILASPFHPQTNGKLERYHQTLKRNMNQLPYEMPSDLETVIVAFVSYYNYRRYHKPAPAKKGGGGHRYHQLIASVGSGGSGSQVRALVNQVRKAQVPGQGGRQDKPALAGRRWPSKAMRIRSGWLRDRICRVLLFWSRLWVSKTIIPKAHEHPLAYSSHH